MKEMRDTPQKNPIHSQNGWGQGIVSWRLAVNL
jgi:hypothetical protein